MWHVWGRREMHRGFWWESMQGRDHFEDLGLHGRINIKMHLKETGQECLIFLGMRTSGGLL
jgi:hypothetical protein